MQAFDPMYPNETSRQYMLGFLVGTEQGGLSGIPDNLLSWAIDRSIQAEKPAIQAGKLFADTYYQLQTQREPRGGIDNRFAYLLAAFEFKLAKGGK